MHILGKSADGVLGERTATVFARADVSVDAAQRATGTSSRTQPFPHVGPQNEPFALGNGAVIKRASVSSGTFSNQVKIVADLLGLGTTMVAIISPLFYFRE